VFAKEPGGKVPGPHAVRGMAKRRYSIHGERRKSPHFAGVSRQDLQSSPQR
jgi:hypothetical protein